ncbi:MAG TPA: sigma-70 family RNA polymerase sigma factor [Actinomycetota bacterium]|nr:sigma-70 family RNA polymerase sigma factor [Actinomycetota bacterium]
MKAKTSALAWTPELESGVARAKEGDQQAFAEIYEVMYPAVARFLYYRLGDRSAAEETAGDVFLAAWRQLSSYRGDHFPAWVFRIARNLAVGRFRTDSRARMVPVEQVSDMPSPEPSPDRRAESADTNQRVRTAIRKLPDDQRDIIVMKFLLGLDNEAVGRAMRKSANAVNAQQHRALRSLHEMLAKEGLSFV